jgi:nitric oxide reductase large subunit
MRFVGIVASILTFISVFIMSCKAFELMDKNYSDEVNFYLGLAGFILAVANGWVLSLAVGFFLDED